MHNAAISRGKAVGGRGLRELGCIVSPDTILRWYRQLVAQKYDGSSRRGPGRPRTPGELAALVAGLALENPSWGYTHIRGSVLVVCFVSIGGRPLDCDDRKSGHDWVVMATIVAATANGSAAT